MTVGSVTPTLEELSSSQSGPGAPPIAALPERRTLSAGRPAYVVDEGRGLVLTTAALVLVTLLFLPAVLMCVLFSGSMTTAWRRARAVHRRLEPMRLPDLPAAVPDSAARTVVAARAGGPPGAGEACDRCASAAVAAVYLPVGRLLLCGHHGRQYQRVLRAGGAVIVGELSFTAPAVRAPA